MLGLRTVLRGCAMFRFLTAAMVMVALTGCLPVPQETQDALDSVEAMGKPPVVTQPHRETQYVNCEVKNNKGGSCLIEDQGNVDEQPTSAQLARNRALAIPFPADCRTPDITPDYDNGYTDSEVAAIKATLKRTNQVCVDWQQAVYRTYPEIDAATDALGQKFNAASKVTMDNIDLMSAVESAQRSANARRAEARQRAAAPEPVASGMCANPYGGAAAQGGQYICSNQGELLACQCSGGSCDLISTQSFLCTQAGAVIR